MALVDKCPLCGSELVVEEVEKLLKGGKDVALVKVPAGVCKKCGEIVYEAETVKRFQEIREKLKKGQVAQFTPLGNSYKVD